MVRQSPCGTQARQLSAARHHADKPNAVDRAHDNSRVLRPATAHLSLRLQTDERGSASSPNEPARLSPRSMTDEAISSARPDQTQVAHQVDERGAERALHTRAQLRPRLEQTGTAATAPQADKRGRTRPERKCDPQAKRSDKRGHGRAFRNERDYERNTKQARPRSRFGETSAAPSAPRAD